MSKALSEIPNLHYTLPHAPTPKSLLQMWSIRGQLVGWNTVDETALRGTKVRIFWISSEQRIITHVFQWQREGVDGFSLLSSRAALSIPPHYDPPETYPMKTLEEISTLLHQELDPPPLLVVIDQQYPERRRAYTLATMLAQMQGRVVSYLPIHGWEDWMPSTIEKGVLHVMDVFHKGPLVFLKALGHACKTGRLPAVLVIPPQIWQAVRMWHQEHDVPIKTMTTNRGSTTDPAHEGIEKEVDDMLSNMSGEDPPFFRTRHQARNHSTVAEAIRWLTEQGHGKMGRSSTEAWNMAMQTIPAHLKK